jgi:Dockerin type I domain
MEIIIALIAIVVLGAIWFANRKTGFDANQDGKVDAADIKVAVEKTVDAVKETADANKDGKIDAADVKVVTEKVESVTEQAVEEVKTVAIKTAAKAKSTAINAKETVKKAANRGRKPKSK